MLTLHVSTSSAFGIKYKKKIVVKIIFNTIYRYSPFVAPPLQWTSVKPWKNAIRPGIDTRSVMYLCFLDAFIILFNENDMIIRLDSNLVS